MSGEVDYDRGLRGQEQARRLIGRRVQWKGETCGGTVTDTTRFKNGYPLLVIRWDDGAPEWWGTVVSPRNESLSFTPSPTDGSEA